MGGVLLSGGLVQGMPAQHLYRGLSMVPVDLASLSDLVGHRGEDLLVEVDERVQGALQDVQGRERGQEVVTDEKAEEHEVFCHTLQVKAHTHLGRQGGVLQLELLPQQ
jgi:hypothetical protein